MSKEAHPNINAVGLVTDIFSSVKKYIRGSAAGKEKEVFELLGNEISEFALKVSVMLDDKFGRK